MKKKIVITSISLILLLLISGLVYAYNTPENKLKRQLNLGDKYLNEQNYEEAIFNYIKAIEIEPKNIEARLNLVKAYISTQKLDKAEKALLEVLEIDPKNITAREYIIQMYLSQNKIDEAEKMLKQIFEIDPKKDEQEIIKAINLAKKLELSKQNYNSGINLMKGKKYIEAMDSFEKVIEADKERYPDAQNKIIECKNSYINENLQKAKNEAQNKNYKAAISYLDLVLQIDSTNSEANKLKSEYTESLKKQQAARTGMQLVFIESVTNDNKIKIKDYYKYTSGEGGIKLQVTTTPEDLKVLELSKNVVIDISFYSEVDRDWHDKPISLEEFKKYVHSKEYNYFDIITENGLVIEIHHYPSP